MALVSTFHRTGEADLSIVAVVKYSIASERGKEIVNVATRRGHIHQWQVQLMEPAKQTDVTSRTRELILSYSGLEAKKHEDAGTQEGKKKNSQARNLELNRWKPPAAAVASSSLLSG